MSDIYADEPCQTRVSGDVRIEGNRKSDLEDAVGANVYVAKRDTLVLAGNFTGCIWLDGPDAVKTAFGLVDADYFRTGRGDALVGGAHNFRHEADDDFGCVATNGAGDAILVWNNALETDAATGLRFCDVMDKEESGYSWEDPEEVPEEDPEEVPVRYFEFTGASPKPVFVEPGPIAFQSIERQDDDWVLVATNARRWCWYSLWSGTTPETNGFELVEGSSNQWMSADGPITNRVPVRESESSRFWLLRGAPGCAPSITEGR